MLKQKTSILMNLPSTSSVINTCGTFASVAELVPAIGSTWAVVGVADVLLVSFAELVSRGDCDGTVETFRPDSSNWVRSIRVSSMPSDARVAASANVKRAAGC